MIDPVLLPPVDAIIDLHAALIAEHGGVPGVRDRGPLEAALARPLQILAYHDGPVTVFDMAAAVCFAICRSHPFIDGNKRAGFIALGVILDMNGLYLDVSEREAADTILALAAGEFSEPDFRDWVARNSFEDHAAAY